MARNVDVAASAEKLRYYAGWATKLTGETVDVSLPGTWHAYTLREPVGVAGLIVPWNFPLMMAVSKMAPALAAGCTIILKPAEQTPLTAIRLGELVQEVGFPDGVINIVTGFGETGAAIVEHPGVDKVSFTGSTEVGKIILGAARGNLKRVTLELGGKSPVIVFPDADMDKAIEGASRGMFTNTGQVCAAGSRLYAHPKVFDQMVEGISRFAEKLKVGSGIDPATDMGPVVSQEQFDPVTGYLHAGAAAGAKAVIGGGSLDREGYFVQPTILTGTTAEMSVRREEIFGPVLCAMTFDDDDLDRIATEANDTEYGLSAYVWTQNIGTAP
jgi:phenylacetaldehyde dehydrogenase